MNSFLELIKSQNKALLIVGKKGSGKPLLASCLTAGVNTARLTIHQLLCPRCCCYQAQTIGRDSDPEVIIVEGFVNDDKDMTQLISFITDNVNNIPLFIFETDKPVNLSESSCRFYIIELSQ